MRKRVVVSVFWVMGIFSLSVTAADPIKIAAIFAQTGIAATHNAPFIQMVELAVEELNGQSGLLDRPVELIVLDNQSTPLGSRLAAKEAVRLQVIAVIGASWSSHSLAVAPILQQAGIPMITPDSTNPKVTRIGNYIFRVCFTDSFQGRAMAQFAYTEQGARTAIVLKIINEEYSLTLAESFVNAFKQYGGKVLLEESYKGKAVDFKDILKRVKTLQPDVVFVPGYARDSGLLIKQAVSMGIQTTFLGGDGWSGQIYDYGVDALEGSYHSTHWHPNIRFPQSVHLQKIYKQKYAKEIPVMTAALEYDAVMLLADAVHRAGTFDRARIRDALAETQGFQGATGMITFDKHGDPLNKEVIIIKLEKGESVYFQTVTP